MSNFSIYFYSDLNLFYTVFTFHFCKFSFLISENKLRFHLFIQQQRYEGITFDLFYLLFPCLKANSWILSRGYLLAPSFNLCVLSVFDLRITWSLVTRLSLKVQTSSQWCFNRIPFNSIFCKLHAEIFSMKRFVVTFAIVSPKFFLDRKSLQPFWIQFFRAAFFTGPTLISSFFMRYTIFACQTGGHSLREKCFSGPYFRAFGLNTERQLVYGPEKLRIWTLFTQ